MELYWWFSASLQYHRSVRDEKITVNLHFAIYLMLQASHETNVVIAKASVYIYIEHGVISLYSYKKRAPAKGSVYIHMKHGYLQRDQFVFIWNKATCKGISLYLYEY